MFKALGEWVLSFLENLGGITLLTGRVFKQILLGRVNIWNTLDQMVILGIRSLPITLITALFVGMAFTIQVVREFLKFGASSMVGGVVALAIWRELGPMLTAVVVSGRVGAAISAELGTMNVTEQVEALEAMSQDPVNYLVAPRVIAVAVMLPLLVGMADVVGFLGGFLVAVSTKQVNPYSYFQSADTMLNAFDIVSGLIKAFFFGLVISLIGCYTGLNAKAGAKGVGLTTTHAVVVSLIVIFILNYFLSVILFARV